MDISACLLVLCVAVCTAGEQVPTGYPLLDGQQVHFKQTVIATSGGLDVVMCDRNNSCSGVIILGVAHGRMGEHWNATFLTNTASEFKTLTKVPGSYGWRYLDEVVFVAHRSAQQLRIWVDGFPQTQASVTLQPGEDELKFVSFIGPVTLLDVPGHSTEGYPMRVGQQVSVLVNATPGWIGQLRIGVSGVDKITQVMVFGMNAEHPGYIVGVPRYNSPDNMWTQILEKVSEPKSMALGEYWFEVKRQSELLYELWAREIPDWRIQLPTGDSELKVMVVLRDPIFTTRPALFGNVALYTK